MEWSYWLDRNVFVQLKKGGVYSGKVIEVDDKDSNIIFITLIDKFGNRVTFVHSELLKIVEES